LLLLLQLPSFTQGGLGWFTDLTVPDPYMALPLFAAGLTGAMVHSGLLLGAGGGLDPNTTKTMQRAGYFGAAVLVPFGYKASAAIAMMWATTSALQLGSALLLKNTLVRNMLGLPPESSVPPADNPMLSWFKQQQKGINQVAAIPASSSSDSSSSSSSSRSSSATPPPPGNPGWLKTVPRGVKVKLR
jgi:YidC/Oxa1 family membrane protein insertase